MAKDNRTGAEKLRDALSSQKIPSEIVTLKAFKDPQGKPLRVLVRDLSVREDWDARKMFGSDDFRNGLIRLTFAMRDPDTDEAVFKPEDVEMLESKPPSFFHEVLTAFAGLQGKTQATAKN